MPLTEVPMLMVCSGQGHRPGYVCPLGKPCYLQRSLFLEPTAFSAHPPPSMSFPSTGPGTPLNMRLAYSAHSGSTPRELQLKPRGAQWLHISEQRCSPPHLEVRDSPPDSAAGPRDCLAPPAAVALLASQEGILRPACPGPLLGHCQAAPSHTADSSRGACSSTTTAPGGGGSRGVTGDSATFLPWQELWANSNSAAELQSLCTAELDAEAGLLSKAEDDD